MWKTQFLQSAVLVVSLFYQNKETTKQADWKQQVFLHQYFSEMKQKTTKINVSL